MTRDIIPQHSELATINRPAVVHGDVKRDALSLADYARLKGGFRVYRDLLICKCLFATGLRISELLALEGSHIGREGPDTYIMIRRGKKSLKNPKHGKAPEWEPVDLSAEIGVELWGYANGNGTKAGDLVFKVTRRHIERQFHHAGVVSLGYPVHPHQLRALYITYLMDNGVPVEAASKMVGHADTRTTMRHYYNLSREKRREVQKRIPA